MSARIQSHTARFFLPSDETKTHVRADLVSHRAYEAYIGLKKCFIYLIMELFVQSIGMIEVMYEKVTNERMHTL